MKVDRSEKVRAGIFVLVSITLLVVIVVLVAGGTRRPVSPGSAGLRKAAALFAAVQGAEFRQGAMWNVLEPLVNDSGFRGEVAHAASLAEPRKIVVELHLADDPDQK